MEKQFFIKAEKPFTYKDKKVIGSWSRSIEQYLITYTPIFVCLAVIMYILAQNNCFFFENFDPIIAITSSIIAYTVLIKRKFQRKNYVYRSDYRGIFDNF